MFQFPLLQKLVSYKRETVTPMYPLYKENKLTVWKSLNSDASNLQGTPVLLIPALINRHYILDLSDKNSICKALVEQGYSVYLVDWGTATDEDRWQSFSELFLGPLRRIVKTVTKDARKKPIILGYCMGGTMASIYTACFPEEIKALIALTAPIDFSKAGIMTLWTNAKYLDPSTLVDALGNVPAELVQSGFVSLKPLSWFKKWQTAWEKQDNNEFLDSFFTLEQWVNDNIPFPGGIWQEYIKWFYQENRLYNNTLGIGPHKANLANITCPLLTIVADNDHIVPPESAEPLHHLVSSEDNTLKHFKGGHVGVIASSKLFPQLTTTINQWLEQHQYN